MEEQNPESSETTRSYWSRWSKRDFFPEQSFESFTSYRTAVSQTSSRLLDRLLNRSTDITELVNLTKESENPLKRCLNWWDLIWLGFGAVVGSGIFTLTGQEAHEDAGPAIVLSYVASGLSALLSAFCYTEFAVEIPVAGGSFSYLRVELGDFVAFIAAGNILLEAIVGAAGLGRSWSSYFTSMIYTDANSLRIYVSSLAEGFNQLDPIAVIILVIVNGIAMAGTRITSSLNWITSMVSAGMIVFIIVLGFIHSERSNLIPFFPYGASGVFRAAAVVYWSYTGFDMVATMAEETKNPPKDVPVGLVGSMSVVTVVYCLMALVLTSMVKYTDIDVNAPYPVAFEQIGLKWAKYVVAICALKGMTTSLLVGSLGQARYTTQIARAHMIPPWFALVHPKTRTPIYATLLVTVASCIVALFSSLDVLSSVFSFSTLFIFMLIAVSLLVRRYYVKDYMPRKDLVMFVMYIFFVVGSSVAITSIWNVKYGTWVGYAITGFFWVFGTLGMQLLPQRRSPKTWGVPLVPWIPSLSILMNTFLIGSLGYVAFLRFVICSAVMVGYYLLFGLHATYDVAHQNNLKVKMEERNKDSIHGEVVDSVI